ncbi:Hypothetical protein NTJ_16193 [Nesidiocoris tenuis]|uniref:Uncharacterized protein n=1 Tax=Nesidiocoris tenuis TaxID=355587 RepID=A0ABN7BG80_9HEMI|nr:Hypothetical protein NTJ_16193 [Nesidiocoris tenuis]
MITRRLGLKVPGFSYSAGSYGGPEGYQSFPFGLGTGEWRIAVRVSGPQMTRERRRASTVERVPSRTEEDQLVLMRILMRGGG